MIKALTGVVGAILLAGIVAGAVYWQKNGSIPYIDSVTPAATSTTSAPHESLNPGVTGGTDVPDSSTPPPVNAITSTAVAQHASRTSCWSTINGTVYDLTSWIPNHPGGEGAIVQLCGRDGSSKFNNQHGGQSAPLMALAGFKIGIAAK